MISISSMTALSVGMFLITFLNAPIVIGLNENLVLTEKSCFIFLMLGYVKNFFNKLQNFICFVEVRYRRSLKKIKGVHSLTKIIIECLSYLIILSQEIIVFDQNYFWISSSMFVWSIRSAFIPERSGVLTRFYIIKVIKFYFSIHFDNQMLLTFIFWNVWGGCLVLDDTLFFNWGLLIIVFWKTLLICNLWFPQKTSIFLGECEINILTKAFSKSSLSPVSNAVAILKQYFFLVSMKSRQDPLPSKQMFLLTKLIKL